MQIHRLTDCQSVLQNVMDAYSRKGLEVDAKTRATHAVFLYRALFSLQMVSPANSPELVNTAAFGPPRHAAIVKIKYSPGK